mmetsp:Transcript_44517/g.139638  ORF Transcript_44517/g.139638 Transcript_44517/m.139638 type:complete len:217 (-) Transcript_44517:989-1639(-)
MRTSFAPAAHGGSEANRTRESQAHRLALVDHPREPLVLAPEQRPRLVRHLQHAVVHQGEHLLRGHAARRGAAQQGRGREEQALVHVLAPALLVHAPCVRFQGLVELVQRVHRVFALVQDGVEGLPLALQGRGGGVQRRLLARGHLRHGPRELQGVHARLVHERRDGDAGELEERALRLRDAEAVVEPRVGDAMRQPAQHVPGLDHVRAQEHLDGRD